MREPKGFYDHFGDKLLQDYLQGNRRMERAITLSLSWIPHTARTIIDIGCGIGWSSHELARHFPRAEVLGVDLSNELLATGEKLFARDNLKYESLDIATDLLPGEQQFDVAIMLDVFEHIPAGNRTFFEKGLGKLLRPGAIVVLTCPSIYHQRFLRDHRPEGLQPVDEDVTAEDLIRFAVAMEGELIYYSYQRIWRPADYLHAVLWKKRDDRPPSTRSSNCRLESKWSRQRRVARSGRKDQLPKGIKYQIGRLLLP